VNRTTRVRYNIYVLCVKRTVSKAHPVIIYDDAQSKKMWTCEIERSIQSSYDDILSNFCHGNHCRLTSDSLDIGRYIHFYNLKEMHFIDLCDIWIFKEDTRLILIKSEFSLFCVAWRTLPKSNVQLVQQTSETEPSLSSHTSVSIAKGLKPFLMSYILRNSDVISERDISRGRRELSGHKVSS
jgi:hypothetical protein